MWDEAMLLDQDLPSWGNIMLRKEDYAGSKDYE